MIEQSIFNGIQWAVFEPNDHRLWAGLRLNIDSFMNGLFRAGAFQGEKSSDAYFVRCGLGDTMVQGDIDRGQVHQLAATCGRSHDRRRRLHDIGLSYRGGIIGRYLPRFADRPVRRARGRGFIRGAARSEVALSRVEGNHGLR